jgi:hypothetical protein
MLLRLPLLASQAELRERAEANLDWYSAQLASQPGGSPGDGQTARRQAAATVETLFAGWRDPLLRRGLADGRVVEETGVPLRAMVAYLFGEVAKNFYLIHNPGQWIECVTRSQGGDTSFAIEPGALPPREAMEQEHEWDAESEGPGRLDAWLRRCGAVPADYNRGLDDGALSADEPPEFHRLEGSSFFRGLALIDMAGAMLKRAFGSDAVAVRVNAAGQGDFFQAHVDTAKADPPEVKRFLQAAFYRRFGLAPSPAFVEMHPGGGACGVRLSRYAALAQLVRRLQRISAG